MLFITQARNNFEGSVTIIHAKVDFVAGFNTSKRNWEKLMVGWKLLYIPKLVMMANEGSL